MASLTQREQPRVQVLFDQRAVRWPQWRVVEALVYAGSVSVGGPVDCQVAVIEGCCGALRQLRACLAELWYIIHLQLLYIA